MLFQESQGKSLQFGITAACGAGFLLFGYDQGIFGGLLDNEPFLSTFGNPNVTIQGQIVATYDIGCIIGTLVSMFFGDRLGRRRCILVGCCILIVGAVLQTASYSLAQMIVGRVVAGLGNGMNTVAIPVWLSETAQAKDRGKLMVAQLVTNVFGIVVANVCPLSFSLLPLSPIYRKRKTDHLCLQVGELWFHLPSAFPCKLEVPSCLPMFLCNHHCWPGSCHPRISSLARDERS